MSSIQDEEGYMLSAIKRSCFLLTLVLTVTTALGQNVNLQFEHLETGDGLSQSSVIAITQDHYGFMWFGTRDGLNRYDGNSFDVFHHSPSDSTSLSNSDISSLFVDHEGDLWVGTFNGLNLFSLQSQTISRFSNNSEDVLQLTDNTILSICDDRFGRVWVGTKRGINIIDKGQNKVLTVLLSDSFKGEDVDHIRCVYKDSKGSMWVGTTSGLFQIKLDENGSLQKPRHISKGLPEEIYVQAIVEMANGTTYIGTKRKGLYIYDNSELKTYYQYYATEFPENDVRALQSRGDDELWAGTYNGLIKVDNKGSYIQIQNNPIEPGSLSKNTIKALYVDDSDLLWVGTYYGGINYWTDTYDNFKVYESKIDGSGLGYNVVSSIVEDDRFIYVGTEGGGISKIDWQSDYIQNITKDKYNIPSDNIKSLLYLEEVDQLWVGTFDNGIGVLNPNRLEIISMLNVESGLSNNSIYSIAKVDANSVCIATLGSGLDFYNLSESTVKNVRHEAASANSLCSDIVRVVMVDRSGNIWAGTEKGLSKMNAGDYKSGHFVFTHFLYDPSSQSGADVLTVFQDSEGNVWVGTKELGLLKMVDGELISMNLIDADDLGSRTIHSIEEDSKGMLWLGTNTGILAYNPESNQKRVFKESDGLVSNEYNNNAALKSANGSFYYGGPNGVSYFNPENIKANEYAPDVILVDLDVNNKRIEPNDESQILSHNFSNTYEIDLDYDQSIFTIFYTLPNYVNPSKNTYAYRLLGLEDEWKTSFSSSASYTIQEPGSYYFQVKGSNSDGLGSEVVTELKINVHPAPWRSWWAFLIYGCVVTFALIAYFRIVQSREAFKRDLEVEHQLNEQQAELNKMKLQFFTNISHEFRTPLTLVLGTLEQILREYKGGNQLYKQLIVMQQSAGQLLKLINQLMDFRKLENKQARLEAAEGNIIKFAKEIFISFKTLAQKGNYKYTFVSESDDIKVYYDRDKLERVLYNLLSNAFKFTPEEGHISMEISDQQDHVNIMIRDSGKGINSSDIDRIFDRFYQTKSDVKLTETTRGTGIGLALSKGIIDLHHGDITVESTEGNGSLFTVKLRKGREHLEEGELIESFRDSEDVLNYDQVLVQSKPVTDPETLLKKDGSKTILVVEDNPHVRGLLVSGLSDDYNVIQAENGRLGFQAAIDEVPDIVISDVMMPEMDGIELCSSIKDHLKTSHIPVILLTARTSLIFKYDGLESGADEYINKPFNLRELQLKVRNMLQMVDRLKSKFKQSTQLTPSEVTTSSKDEELLAQAIAIVDQNISNEFFDVPLFCTELGVSRTMLFTKVKAWTNMTPNEFIQSMRMKRAAQLLEQGKTNISQVCFNVGYKNPKYFTRLFHKHFELTPSEYSARFNSEIDQE